MNALRFDRAARLRVLRAGFKLSQLETGLRSGIAQWRYWRIENGYLDPTDPEQRAIARTLKCPVAAAFPDLVDAPGPGRGRGVTGGGAAHV